MRMAGASHVFDAYAYASVRMRFIKNVRMRPAKMRQDFFDVRMCVSLFFFMVS